MKTAIIIIVIFSFMYVFGAFQDKPVWPYTCIDWDSAARELMYDYVSDNGYYFRSI